MIGRIRSSASFDEYTSRKRADVSRLLDPTYDASSSSEQRQVSYGAYVDAKGEFHDPDYRQFPLIQPVPHKSTASYRSYSGSYGNYYNNNQRRRQPWDLSEEDAALLLEEEEEYASQENSRRNSGSMSYRTYAAKRRTPPYNYYSTKGLYSSSGAILSPCSNHQHDFNLQYYAPSSSSSDSSYSTQAPSVLGSQLEGEKEKEKSRCRIGALKRKRRRSSGATEKEEKKSKKIDEKAAERDVSPPHRNSLLGLMEEEEEEREREEEDDDDEVEAARRDRVPTCTETLVRQWQALSFRIRFGLFRAERRIKKRVRSLSF